MQEEEENQIYGTNEKFSFQKYFFKK